MPNRFPRVSQTTLDSGGGGSITFTVPAGVRWAVGPTTVTVSSNTSEPQANIYINGTTQQNRVSGTYSGSNDTDPDVHQLGPGDTITCVWSGGDAGAVATLRIGVLQVEG